MKKLRNNFHIFAYFCICNHTSSHIVTSVHLSDSNSSSTSYVYGPVIMAQPLSELMWFI